MQYFEVILKGNASQTSKKLTLSPSDLDLTLLEYLQLNNTPIASSCSGKGACERCMVNTNKLACEYTVKKFLAEFGNTVEVDYL